MMAIVRVQWSTYLQDARCPTGVRAVTEKRILINFQAHKASPYLTR